MKRTASGLLAVGMALMMTAGPAQAVLAPVAQVDVVFVLDTTGSMGGLIEGAKQKIWSIAGAIAQGQPAPLIRMGLIGYRDRGDDYVTKVFNLSDKLDPMYRELLSFQAQGGGDTPEHVLKALNEAVEQMSWRKESSALKIIYLVGDAPAQAQYGDTPALESIVAAAARKGIIVNAIQCGAQPDTAQQWRQIAQLGHGTYLPIAQDGGMRMVETPYDRRIAEISARLDATGLGYGAGIKSESEGRALAKSVSTAGAPAALADRAAYKKEKGYFSSGDLVKDVEENKVQLENLTKSDLPAELQSLNEKERKAKITAIGKERVELEKNLEDLTRQRSEHLKANAGDMPKDSFDKKLMDSLKEQAQSKGILYR